jgi:hypothetical protein
VSTRRQPHLPSLAPLAPPSERTFQSDILELLALLGWRAVHHHPLRTKAGWRTGIEGPGCAGFPDLFAVKVTPYPSGGNRVLAAELKSATGRVEADQAEWLRLLAAGGVETYIWRAGSDSLQAIAEVLS